MAETLKTDKVWLRELNLWSSKNVFSNNKTKSLAPTKKDKSSTEQPSTKLNLTPSTDTSTTWKKKQSQPKEWALLNWTSIDNLMIRNKRKITWERIWPFKINLRFNGNVINEINRTIWKYIMIWLNHIFKVIKDIHKFHNWRRSKKYKLKKNRNKRWKMNCKVRFREIRNS